MTLLDGKIGGSYKVEEVELTAAVARRLQALGLTYGTRVEIMNYKKSGSVIFKVRGTRLAVGKRIAGSIKIKEAA